MHLSHVRSEEKHREHPGESLRERPSGYVKFLPYKYAPSSMGRVRVSLK
jgi:hypothetical protein